MFTPALYIEGQRCDLFEDETIQLTDSIRNLREPDLFFSAYSQQFSIPASPKNNSIFSHYHNSDIVDGFDARVRHDAELRINGVPFRKGQIKLNEVQIKHGVPETYSIVFYGDGSRLKEELQGTKLSDLSSLSVLDHDYTGANVKAGFEKGLKEVAGVISAVGGGDAISTADIVYPFISHTGQYILDDTVTGKIYRLDPDDPTDTTTQLRYQDLKPAIRLTTIIDAIENDILQNQEVDKRSTFDRTGFLGDTQFGNLWMWCHREKGGLVAEGTQYNNFFFADSTYDAVNSDIDLTFTRGYFWVSFPDAKPGEKFDFSLDVTITGSGNYNVRSINGINSKTIYEANALSGSQTLTWSINPFEGNDYVIPNFYFTTENTITDIEVKLTVVQNLNDPDFDRTAIYTWPSVATVDFVSINANMPDISCLDFLTGLFKMFNLTISRSNSIYYIDTMDDFYTGGATRDLTRYVDDTGYTVIPPVPFDDIELKFSEPGSYLIDKRIELVGEVYGDETYNTGLLFEDNDYEIEVPFEKILWERMTDISDNSLETNMWAWCVDPQEDPYIGEPIIFHYNVAIPSTIMTITWEHDAVTSTAQAMCSNTVNDGTDWTLTFGSELGEYTNQPISGDLFTEYWRNYITGVYNAKARTIKVKAWLPPSFMTQYNLGDTIRYKNKEYFINELTLNLLTGESELELVTKWL